MSSDQKIPHWNKKFLTGIPDIDFQHKYFLMLIERFHQQAKEVADRHMLTRLFNEIIKYADFHFYSEENFMHMIHFPLLEEQHEQHRDLIENLATTINYYEMGTYDLDKILHYLLGWFTEHTIKEDIKIAEFLAQDAKK